MAKTREQVNTEALSIVRKRKRSGVAISMGVGKTKIGLDHFQLVVNKVEGDNPWDGEAKALVVAPTLKIHKGWLAETEKWNITHLDKGLDFVTYRSLHKKDLSDYDVIYLDECHNLLPKHGDQLSEFDGYILGLTGTPPKRKTSMRARLIAAYCPIVYEYLTDEAVDDKILNDYRITVHLLPLGKEKNYKIELKTKNKDPKKRRVLKSWWTSETENYAYWTDRLNEVDDYVSRSKLSVMRMKAMHRYPTKDEYAKQLLHESKGKCILFANEQKQADLLCSHSYHSNNKDAEKNMEMFEQGIITKLSCVLQLSEGANIAGLNHVIILHMYGNNRKGPQRIGRALRLNPDDTCHIDILCFKDTIDVEWVKAALTDFKSEKITWYDTEVF